MPTMGPSFDKLVFDVGVFDSMYAVPLLTKVAVNREHRLIAPGEAVEVTIYIKAAVFSGQRYSLNTVLLPTIVIYKPDYTVLTAETNMYNNGDTGVYSYQHQSTVGDSKGAYTAVFKAVNGDRVMLSDQMMIFEVI